jgi:hypothetical protein
MAYSIAENALLGQAFGDTSTKKIYELGTIFRGKDPTYGGAEFIYLLGVANTVVGSVVTWDDPTHQTTLAAAGKEIVGALAAAAATNGPTTVVLHIDRPRMQGGIT